LLTPLSMSLRRDSALKAIRVARPPTNRLA
jgi:hypothetical protein